MATTRRRSSPEPRKTPERGPLYFYHGLLGSFGPRAARAREFLHRLWVNLQGDDVFFMAGAVAFNLIVATLPLVLLAIGVTGYVLAAQVADPVEATVSLVVGLVPQGAGDVDLVGIVRSVVAGALEQRTGFTILGALLFTWLATSLVGTLRVVLREIFDVGHDRGILLGKLFDVQVVALSVLLLTLNLGVTVTFRAAIRFGVDLLGLGGPVLGLAERVFGAGVALLSIWSLFLVIYRYLPARRIPWRTAMVAATFAALLHESLKVGFTWYATDVADYSSTWGNLATIAIFIFWIYYEALVFILGGEVAHAYSCEKAGKVKAGAIPGEAS